MVWPKCKNGIYSMKRKIEREYQDRILQPPNCFGQEFGNSRSTEFTISEDFWVNYISLLSELQIRVNYQKICLNFTICFSDKERMPSLLLQSEGVSIPVSASFLNKSRSMQIILLLGCGVTFFHGHAPTLWTLVNFANVINPFDKNPFLFIGPWMSLKYAFFFPPYCTPNFPCD